MFFNGGEFTTSILFLVNNGNNVILPQKGEQMLLLGQIQEGYAQSTRGWTDMYMF